MPERRRRRTTGEILALSAGVLLVLGIPTWLVVQNFLIHRAANIKLAEEWSINGHPCPEVSAAEFADRRLQAPKGTTYDDTIFFREFGHLTCTSVKDHGGTGLGVFTVCQFTSPNVLRVKTPKGEWFFVPGAGQPATVVTPHGVARCVLASNFKIRSENPGLRKPLA